MEVATEKPDENHVKKPYENCMKPMTAIEKHNETIENQVSYGDLLGGLWNLRMFKGEIGVQTCTNPILCDILGYDGRQREISSVWGYPKMASFHGEHAHTMWYNPHE